MSRYEADCSTCLVGPMSHRPRERVKGGVHYCRTRCVWCSRSWRPWSNERAQLWVQFKIQGRHANRLAAGDGHLGAQTQRHDVGTQPPYASRVSEWLEMYKTARICMRGTALESGASKFQHVKDNASSAFIDLADPWCPVVERAARDKHHNRLSTYMLLW